MKSYIFIILLLLEAKCWMAIGVKVKYLEEKQGLDAAVRKLESKDNYGELSNTSDNSSAFSEMGVKDDNSTNSVQEGEGKEIKNSIISLESLTARFEEFRNGKSKNLAILRGVFAILSIIASSSLIWLILRSRKGLSTTQNRILFGLSISDIVFSLNYATFGVMIPKDVNYMIWNARGNMATCNTVGYLNFFGATMGLLYNCSLNLYYLVVVRYNKSDEYITKKIEPYLHIIPIIFAFAISTTFLAKEHFNPGAGGFCSAPAYNPPHCKGYEDGELRDGFEIPCGRGVDGGKLFFYIASFTTGLFPPIFIGTSLCLIYKAVSKVEKKAKRYGFNTVIANIQQRMQGNKSKSSNNRRRSRKRRKSKTTLVKEKAIGYAISYFLAWSFIIILHIFFAAGKEFPFAMRYLNSIFNVSQGSFTFLTYIYFRMLSIKDSPRNRNISWIRAFGMLLLSKGKKRTQTTNSPFDAEDDLEFGVDAQTMNSPFDAEDDLEFGVGEDDSDDEDNYSRDNDSDSAALPGPAVSDDIVSFPAKSPVQPLNYDCDDKGPSSLTGPHASPSVKIGDDKDEGTESQLSTSSNVLLGNEDVDENEASSSP